MTKCKSLVKTQNHHLAFGFAKYGGTTHDPSDADLSSIQTTANIFKDLKGVI